MTDARGAGPAERAQHARDAGPAPADVGETQAERGLAAVARGRPGADLAGARGDCGEAERLARCVPSAGEASLRTRPPDCRDLEIGRLKAKVGDLTMGGLPPPPRVRHPPCPRADEPDDVDTEFGNAIAAEFLCIIEERAAPEWCVFIPRTHFDDDCVPLAGLLESAHETEPEGAA